MNTETQTQWRVVSMPTIGRGTHFTKAWFTGTLAECVAYQIAHGIKFFTRLIQVK